MEIPKEDRLFLIDKLNSLISNCDGCESCDEDKVIIRKLRKNTDFTKWEFDSLATRRSITHNIEEINQIKRTWRKAKSF